jgi:hypothetical protein
MDGKQMQYYSFRAWKTKNITKATKFAILSVAIIYIYLFIYLFRILPYFSRRSHCQFTFLPKV